jgi:hypothetical protein
MARRVNQHQLLLAKQVRRYGMTYSEPPTRAACILLNTCKPARSLEKFVTHEFPLDQVDKAMAQACDIDARMKLATPSRG